ncbi:MAG: hypothetical protein FWE80_03105 [Oscillospiraceae bacterium]|nr:hypothetical protein [Oscillospiraceae bacterium]
MNVFIDKTHRSLDAAKRSLLSKGLIFYALMFFAAAFLLEIFVFNFKAIQTASYEEQRLTFDYAQQNGQFEVGDFTVILADDGKSIEIININREINNLYINIANKNPKPAKQVTGVSIFITDKANALYAELPARDIHRGIERSQYLSVYTLGDSQELKIRVNAAEGEQFQLNALSLNKPIPVFFSAGRFLFIFFLLSFIKIFAPGSKLYRIRCDAEKMGQRCITALLCIAICFVFAAMIQENTISRNPAWVHHQQYAKLTNALLKGQVYLDDIPPEALETMDNPYDTALRKKVMEETGSSYIWDTAYFNGKYYVYFGLTPVVLLYIPVKLITGLDLNNAWAVLFFCCVIVFAAFGVVRRIIRKWFPDTPFSVYILLSLTLVFGSGTLRLLSAPHLYEVPNSAAIALALTGLYCWLSAIKSGPAESGGPDGPENHQVSIPLLTAGAVCIALLAGCRPHLLLCALFAIPLFWDVFIKQKFLFSRKGVFAAVGFCLPFILIGAGIMYYNYIRFGSVADFGATYNLTTNDMTSRGFVWERIPVGIWMYFFQPANLTAKFPYVTGTGFYTQHLIRTIYESNWGGVFNNILLLSNFLVFRFRGGLKQKKLFGFTLLCILISFIASIFLTQYSGVLGRYILDFAFLLFLSAFVILLLIQGRLRDEYKRYVYLFILIGFFVCALYSLLYCMNFWRTDWLEGEPGLYYQIENAVNFWK